MSKGADEKVVKQELDPLTQRMREEVYNRARGVSNQAYTDNPVFTVAGTNPLSQEGVTGMRRAGDQINDAYFRAVAAGDSARNMAGGLDALGGHYGLQADMLHDRVAGTFDDLGGRMRGVADQYGTRMDDMVRVGEGMDLSADQMRNVIDQAYTRGDTMDQWGSRFNPYMDAGHQGVRALTGDTSALDRFSNPFNQQVIESVGRDYDDQRALASRESRDAATQAGAFGGSRHAIMEGARLGELDQGQMATVAGLRAKGYDDAMARAAGAANLGFGAGEMDLAGRRVGQTDRAQGLEGERIGQGYNQLGLDARGLGATFGGLGLDAERTGQGYNQLGMDARNLGATYDNLGLGARRLGLDAQGLGLNAIGQAGNLAGMGADIAGGIFNAGNYFRNIEQQRLDEQDRRFREKRDWDVRNLDILKGAVTGLPYGMNTREELHKDPLSQLIGAGVTIGGLLL